MNLGAGMEITIREWLTIRNLTGYTGTVRWDTSKPDGQPRRCLDVSRAREEFGFEAQMPFSEGLKRTIACYDAHRAEAGRIQDAGNHC